MGQKRKRTILSVGPGRRRRESLCEGEKERNGERDMGIEALEETGKSRKHPSRESSLVEHQPLLLRVPGSKRKRVACFSTVECAFNFFQLFFFIGKKRHSSYHSSKFFCEDKKASACEICWFAFEFQIVEEFFQFNGNFWLVLVCWDYMKNFW